MKCTRCFGRGDVMTYDPGICGAEEYGTCGLCKGEGTLPPELEALHVKIANSKKRLARFNHD